MVVARRRPSQRDHGHGEDLQRGGLPAQYRASRLRVLRPRRFSFQASTSSPPRSVLKHLVQLGPGRLALDPLTP